MIQASRASFACSWNSSTKACQNSQIHTPTRRNSTARSSSDRRPFSQTVLLSLSFCVCFAWSLFSACEHFLLSFSCNATRSFSHSLLTRSETFLHTWPTLALGSFCACIISSLLPHSAKESCTSWLSSMALFCSFDLDVTPGCFGSSRSHFRLIGISRLMVRIYKLLGLFLLLF